MAGLSSRCSICSQQHQPTPGEAKIPLLPPCLTDPCTWKSILTKICQYLRVPPVPSKGFMITSEESSSEGERSFCTDCIRAFQEIADILTKVRKLELEMQCISEDLGKRIIRDHSSNCALTQEGRQIDYEWGSFRSKVVKSKTIT
jgi:hypothetical protein